MATTPARTPTASQTSTPVRPIAPTVRATRSSDRTSLPSILPVGLPAIRLGKNTSFSETGYMSGLSGGGEPLSPAVQRTLESSLQVNLQSARVHTDTQAQKASESLSARAFTFGNHIFLGGGEQATDLGLMAHEATHIVQQRGAPTLQRSAPGQNDIYEREAQRASAAVVRGESFTVSERTSSHRVQREEKGFFSKLGSAVSSAASGVVGLAAEAAKKLGLDKALNYLADKANLIPGFRMFTIILGVNPINMRRVERSGANILRALIEFIPGGDLITKALQNNGIFDKVSNWIEKQIQTLGMVGSSIKKAITDFLSSLELKDLADLGGVWERAKRIFSEPIDRIITFAKSLASDIITFIKDAILMPLAKLAEGTRGWDLLIAVLGKNPITGAAVPRNAETLIGGFLKLIGQEEVWENMKKANAIPRAWAWFQGALATLKGFVAQIPTLAINAFKSLKLEDIIWVAGAFKKVAAVFGNFIVNFITWAGKAVWNLLEIIFEVVKPGALDYIKKTGAALKSILKNPLPFVGNLVKAAKLGFQNFSDRFGTHLKAGLINWLVGALPGVYIPKAFSLPEFGKFALSVFGISWAQIRGKIVKALGPNGEKIMQGLEDAFDVVKALVTDGPAAAWEVIKEKLTNLKDMIIDAIVGFIKDTVVQKAIPKLIAMFIPGAGFISAIISIYDTIMVFVEKIAKIIEVVKGFIDSIVAIAGGAIDAAAGRVERILAGLLSLAISFLAGFLGLGNIADKILEVIAKVRDTVDKALDAAINWIVTKAKALFVKAKGAVSDWWKAKKPFKTKGGEDHHIYFSGEEKSVIPMVASKDSKPIASKLDEFRELANASDASKEQKKALSMITQTQSALKLNPDDPLIVSNMRDLFGIFDEEGPAKEVQYQQKEQTLPGDSTEVGAYMRIDWLHADYIKKNPGSPPGSGQDKLMEKLVVDPKKRSAFKYVRGHLLNENLGGKGENKNLFPITANANSQHLKSTEKDIKDWVKPEGKKNKKKQYALYEVKVTVRGSKLNATRIDQNYVDSTFNCRVVLKDESGEEKKSFLSSIDSEYEEKNEAEKFELSDYKPSTIKK